MTPLIAELYAVEVPSQRSDDGVYYTQFYYHRQVLEMCLPDHKIIKVRLTELNEPVEGCYWSWKQLLSHSLDKKPLDPPEFHFTCCHIYGVEICFPYGSKAEEALGRGKVVPVQMEIIG